jgi:hypothetical protein
MREARSTIFKDWWSRGAGFPHPALRATFSRWEKEFNQPNCNRKNSSLYRRAYSRYDSYIQ